MNAPWLVRAPRCPAPSPPSDPARNLDRVADDSSSIISLFNKEEEEEERIPAVPIEAAPTPGRAINITGLPRRELRPPSLPLPKAPGFPPRYLFYGAPPPQPPRFMVPAEYYAKGNIRNTVGFVNGN